MAIMDVDDRSLQVDSWYKWVGSSGLNPCNDFDTMKAPYYQSLT